MALFLFLRISLLLAETRSLEITSLKKLAEGPHGNLTKSLQFTLRRLPPLGNPKNHAVHVT